MTIRSFWLFYPLIMGLVFPRIIFGVILILQSSAHVPVWTPDTFVPGLITSVLALLTSGGSALIWCRAGELILAPRESIGDFLRLGWELARERRVKLQGIG
ncbi:MAG TPA: hypothetical protein VN841_20550 [Bryobacteraceae bacterium]|nr:hypothetical protein [Bryobacteraceae bacterium]